MTIDMLSFVLGGLSGWIVGVTTALVALIWVIGWAE